MRTVGLLRRAALVVVPMAVALTWPTLASPAAAVTPQPVHNGRIAFSTGYIGPEPEGGESQIFTVNPDGTGLRQLTHVRKPANAGDPKWSPDGRRIVYVTNPHGHYEIWEMRGDGTGQHLLARTTKSWDYVEPSWSPDGTHLVVARCDDRYSFTAQCEIDVMRADGSHRQRIVGGDHRISGDPVYSPDGRAIAFDSDRAGFESAVWIVKSDGSGIRQVTPAALDAFWPSWSPRGDQLLVTSNANVPRSQVYVVDADGAHLRQLTHVTGGHQAFFASYSPDGRRVLLVSDLRRSMQKPGADVYTMRPDGTGLTRVTHNEPLVVVSSWGARPSVRSSS